MSRLVVSSKEAVQSDTFQENAGCSVPGISRRDKTVQVLAGGRTVEAVSGVTSFKKPVQFCYALWFHRFSDNASNCKFIFVFFGNIDSLDAREDYAIVISIY